MWKGEKGVDRTCVEEMRKERKVEKKDVERGKACCDYDVMNDDFM